MHFQNFNTNLTLVHPKHKWQFYVKFKSEGAFAIGMPTF